MPRQHERTSHASQLGGVPVSQGTSDVHRSRQHDGHARGEGLRPPEVPAAVPAGEDREEVSLYLFVVGDLICVRCL